MYSISNYNGTGNKITPEGIEEVMGVVGSSYSITSLDVGCTTLCFSLSVPVLIPLFTSLPSLKYHIQAITCAQRESQRVPACSRRIR